MAAVDYNRAKFPIGDNTHARFDKRESCKFKNMEYFMERYYEILGFDSDQVFDQFVVYQLLQCEDIPEDAWTSFSTSYQSLSLK